MPSQTSSTLPPRDKIRIDPTPPVPSSGTTDQDMRSEVKLLTRLVAAQAKMRNTSIANRPVSARVRDFINLDPPLFTGSDPKEDPQTFIDQVYRTLRVMHASDTEVVELASYRLRDLAVMLVILSWEISRGPNAPPDVWKDFCEAFLCHYLPVEIRRSRADKFLNLWQGNKSVQEYIMQFDSLSSRQTSANLFELEMVDFDVIMGMNWLASCYANVDCRTKMVRFQFPGEPVIEWKWNIATSKDSFPVILSTIWGIFGIDKDINPSVISFAKPNKVSQRN
ncbi:uncharacterized protein [Nicotiana tomentosiformis]|uniref:uncharacterized protein n=1 Tax=Nicotiana tomentosiformis TaxID=4098 RepID=UPI00388CC7D2